jgi:rod shape-determining protein MreC
VVNLQGLVGRIVSVTSSSSTVKLLTDPDHAVAVQLARSGFVGTASGRGAGDLKFVSSRADGPVGFGEVAVTLAGRYPAGLLVGRVAKDAAPAIGAGVQTTIEPAVDFNQLDFVRVILFLPGTDQTPDGEEPAPAGESTP